MKRWFRFRIRVRVKRYIRIRIKVIYGLTLVIELFRILKQLRQSCQTDDGEDDLKKGFAIFFLRDF
jgi:hypothetical protein